MSIMIKVGVVVKQLYNNSKQKHKKITEYDRIYEERYIMCAGILGHSYFFG